jgi:hypothetical protein
VLGAGGPRRVDELVVQPLLHVVDDAGEIVVAIAEPPQPGGGFDDESATVTRHRRGHIRLDHCDDAVFVGIGDALGDFHRRARSKAES